MTGITVAQPIWVYPVSYTHLSGAGKLPTASSVVGDIVDAAKHLHTNIFTNWNSTPAKLRPLDQVSGRFFVRVKKEVAEEAKEVFENAEMICLDQLPEECAFITTDMTQGEFCLLYTSRCV